MKRRKFIATVVGAAGATGLGALPLPAESYDCSCGLVTYWKQPEGHYAAQYFAGQRFTYALFRQHEHLHRKLDNAVNTTAARTAPLDGDETDNEWYTMNWRHRGRRKN